MKSARFSLLLTLALLGCFFAQGQQAAHVPGQVLVSLQPGLSPEFLIRRSAETLRLNINQADKTADLFNAWLLQTDESDERKLLEWLLHQPEVRNAQFNYLLRNRAEGPYSVLPNDPLFAQQWQYINSGAGGGVADADIDAELAWDITTGGLTPAGDTIVVAVIDGGIDLNHSDLAPNLWVNRHEIPGDNIDNDNNGYVDDFRGWNVYEDNDNIAGLNTGHGTPVSAIVGARGNNAIGVTGVSWNVKILFVSGNSNQAYILSAYDYVLKARQRYNATNGTSGAFITAVNCSWGIDFGQPADAPLWCAAFDSLGAAGILSIAATANNPVDVDVVGDLPTACPSNYLVSVTNLTKADQKAALAAWGEQHVDLGAYGQEVFTAGANNSYGLYNGTSFAAPQVAGAVGLLYSAPCPNLIALTKSDPAAAALWSKQLLLGSVTPNAAMQNLTLTGGRLNLYSYLQAYEDQCNPCPPPFAIHVGDISTGSALLKWSEIPDYQTITLHWRPTGAGPWNTVAGVHSDYLLTGLAPCTEYEFALSADCWQGASSGWSDLIVFKTDGCCEPPASLWTVWTGPDGAELAWQPVTAAKGYRLRVRLAGGPWDIYETTATALEATSLTPCSDYEAQVQTLCETGPTAYSAPLFFKTAACGSCTDVAYCPAKSGDATEEWIKSIEIGDWSYSSGSGGGGYQDFTGQDDPPQLFPQSPVDVTIEPGFSGLPYKELFRIFIDYNMDGDFSEADELAFDPGWPADQSISGQIVPPVFSGIGLTRMRVMMKYKGPNTLAPTPCESFDFGQVEDYCVELASLVTADAPGDGAGRLTVYPQPAGETVWLEIAGTEEWSGDLSIRDVTGKTMVKQRANRSGNKISVPVKDWPSGFYFIYLQKEGRIYTAKLVKG